jgi:hypothetical protein
MVSIKIHITAYTRQATLTLLVRDVSEPGTHAAGVKLLLQLLLLQLLLLVYIMVMYSHPSRATNREPTVQRVAQIHPKTQLWRTNHMPALLECGGRLCCLS